MLLVSSMSCGSKSHFITILHTFHYPSVLGHPDMQNHMLTDPGCPSSQNVKSGRHHTLPFLFPSLSKPPHSKLLLLRKQTFPALNPRVPSLT